MPDARRADLAHEDVAVRQTAVARLIETPAPGLLADLADRLADVDENVRYLAVIAMGKLGAPAASYLANILTGDDPTATRVAAAAALGRLGLDAVAAVDPLCGCLDADEEDLRWHAGFALSRIGDDAVPGLTRVVEAGSPRSQPVAVRSLGWIGAPAESSVSCLRALAESSEPTVSLTCRAALVQITGDPDEGLDQLIAATEDPQTCESAAVAIGELGELGQGGVSTLRDLLQSDDSGIRGAAAMALGRLKADEPETIDALVERLDDPQVDVIHNAIMALASFGAAAESAGEKLHEMSCSADERTRLMARTAIGKIRAGADG